MSQLISYLRSFPPIKTMFGLLLWAMGLIILLSLWQWQLDRLVWKRGLIEQHAFEESLTVLPELSPLNIKTSATDKFILKKYIVLSDKSKIEADKLIFVGPRPKNGVKGSHVYYPLPIENSRIAIITMLGWVANEDKEQLKQNLDNMSLPEKMNGYFVPNNPESGAQNFPKQNIWVSARISDMAKHFNLQVLKPETLDIFANAQKYSPAIFFYTETELSPKLKPRLYKDIEFRNDHAYYAQFWLTMSFAWTIIFLLAALWPIIRETLFEKSSAGDDNTDNNKDKT